jgi:hypothetical protein
MGGKISPIIASDGLSGGPSAGSPRAAAPRRAEITRPRWASPE